MKEKILVVEDDAFLGDGLKEMLTKENYDVALETTVEGALKNVKNNLFNLIILDVMLPDGNGFELCQKIRKISNTPILFLSALDDEIQIVRGLDSGADDYVTKPFKLLELLSRVRALIRRSNLNSSPIKSNDLEVDVEHLSVKISGENIYVTPIEFQILNTLVKNAGVIVTRAIFLDNIWDSDENFIDDNTLSVHISRLREKVGKEHIKTIRGIGYRWEE